MSLQININKLTVTIFVPLFTFSSIGACQEKETKMTLQKMLFKSFREDNQRKSYELVQQAIKESSDLNIQNDLGDTALILAARSGNKEIVQLLLNAKANPDIKNNDGDTALSLAAYYGNKEIAQLLLDANANPDIQDAIDDTALIWATRYVNKEITQLLLDASADIDIKNNINKTALDEAQEKGHKKIVQILKDEQKKRCELVQKEAGEHLLKDLARIVSEYFVSCPKDSSDNKPEKPV